MISELERLKSHTEVIEIPSSDYMSGYVDAIKFVDKELERILNEL